MGAIRGVECKIYMNTETVDPDPYANPDWTEIACARDATLNIEYEEGDATCRGGGGFRMSNITLTAIEVTAAILKDKDSTGYAALEAAVQAKSLIDLVVLDGPIDSDDSDGWRFDAQCFNWSENQPLEDNVTIDATFKPGRSANNPTPFTGTSP